MEALQEELRELRHRRGIIKTQLTKFKNFISIEENQADVEQIEIRLGKIDKYFDEFEVIQARLECLEQDEEKAREEIENTFYSVVSRAKKLMKQFYSPVANVVNPPSGEMQSVTDPLRNINLPRLNLPVFSGKFENWLTFHDEFLNLIHNNASLTNMQKFYYLKSSLKEEPSKLIQAYEISNDNYLIVWNLLIQRYQRKRHIVNSHINALFELPSATKESAVLLREISDGFYRHVNILQKMKLPIKEWDAFLVNLITSKLDNVTIREWETSLDDEDSLPTYEQIIKFLNKKCFTLETGCRKVITKSNAYQSHTSHSYKQVKTNQEHALITSHEYSPKCHYCQQGHFVFNCADFLKLSVPERYEAVKSKRLCLNCLRPGHTKVECRSSHCKKCNLQHSTLLHNNLFGNKVPSAGSETNKVPDVTATAMASNVSEPPMQLNGTTAHAANPKHVENAQPLVLLSTAKLTILDANKRGHICKTLLDSGSQSNIMSMNLARKLKLQFEDFSLPLVGINRQVTNIQHKVKTTIKSCYTKYSANLTFLILPTITGKVPSVSFDNESIKIPSDVSLADPNFNVSENIDLLLGANIFYDLLGPNQMKLNDTLLLQESVLGWIIAGSIALKSPMTRTSRNTAINACYEELNNNLKRFWEIEEIPKNNYLSEEQQIAESYFVKTTTRDASGKFIVRLPFLREINNLGDSYTVAQKRFKSLEYKFTRNEELKQAYVEFMAEYEILNHMTSQGTFKQSLISQPHFILPHHAVIKQLSTTTKCRVVFDGSAKTNLGISLNDNLSAGHIIQDSLFAIVMRLRLYKYVLSSDIKMMFRQIWVHDDDRKFQQILWSPEHNAELNLYTLNTVTYGTACAPFLAQRCLKQLALENINHYPRTCKIILNSFYMDDLLVSLKSKEEALEVYEEITRILDQGGFKLRKWSSNDKTILHDILETSDKGEKTVELRESTDLKTLGIAWLSNSDTFNYSVNIQFNSGEVTKRNVLSTVSKIFDPLGLIGPVTIKAKVFLQRLWQYNMTWDEPLSVELSSAWLIFVRQLQCINDIKIDRQMLIERATVIEIHGFSDASEKAYGACLYLVSVNHSGDRISKLMCAKSKVAPHKKCTLPRLELLAALLLANLVYTVMETLSINITRRIFYTDSTIVLSWLQIEPFRLQTFVANRVSKILEKTLLHEWNYVNTKGNPADVISRGINPEELINSKIWWLGPEFLTTDCSINIEDTVNIIPVDELPEIKKEQQISLKVSTDETFEIFNRYSTLMRLQRVVSFCIRFKRCALKQERFNSTDLTVNELSYSLNVLLKLAQSQEFDGEIVALSNNSKMPRHSKILKLNPFLDNERLLRVGGRLKHSNIEFSQKYPVILPKNSKLTKLIIEHEHKKHLHMGTQNLLSILRLQYWPVDGKNQVKSVLKSCLRCFKANPKPPEFLMGNLPSSRVTPSRPFTKCGVDYAGPILIKERIFRNTKLIKTYICIFVCFATRACHIELVSDLSTDSFLNALKRFISRRGKPSEIISDNGTNFVGASNHFLELHHLLNNEKHNQSIQTFLSKDKINWKFIPAKSPHMGGLWEAAVKSAKFHLRRVVGTVSLAYDEMNTILTQIEACLNSRPLTPLSNDPEDLLPLTPSHFLIGDSLMALPQEDVQHLKLNRMSRYQLVQQLTQQFWTRWSREYLTQLQQRNKWFKNHTSQLKIGSLVLLIEDNQPPLRWPVARVLELHPGTDQKVRVVSLKVNSGGVVKRSIAKICPFPLPDED